MLICVFCCLGKAGTWPNDFWDYMTILMGGVEAIIR